MTKRAARGAFSVAVAHGVRLFGWTVEQARYEVRERIARGELPGVELPCRAVRERERETDLHAIEGQPLKRRAAWLSVVQVNDSLNAGPDLSAEQEGDVVMSLGDLVYRLADELGVSASAIERVMIRQLRVALLPGLV